MCARGVMTTLTLTVGKSLPHKTKSHGPAEFLQRVLSGWKDGAAFEFMRRRNRDTAVAGGWRTPGCRLAHSPPLSPLSHTIIGKHTIRTRGVSWTSCLHGLRVLYEPRDRVSFGQWWGHTTGIFFCYLIKNALFLNTSFLIGVCFCEHTHTTFLNLLNQGLPPGVCILRQPYIKSALCLRR